MSRVTVNIDTSALRARLGLTDQQLPDDASEQQIVAAFAGSPQRCECGGVHAQEFDPASVPDDMVLMERDQWDQVQRRLNVVANVEMTSLLDNAVRRGKFPPSRRAHYANLHELDPADTTRRISAMADDVIPVSERGGGKSMEGDFADVGDAYPEHWLPEVGRESSSRVLMAGD